MDELRDQEPSNRYSYLSGPRRELATPQEERVARAICLAAVGLRTPPYLAQFVEAHWPNHIPGARAAIAAYPEPPKVKPVEGDEVWVQMPGSDLRCRGNLVVVRHEWAWVEVRVGATTFVTALYGELERA